MQAAGVPEAREDAPLKASWGGWGGGGAGGPRLVAGAFAALSAAVTLALLAQIYAGDYQLVPHGAVACEGAAGGEGTVPGSSADSGALCSGAGLAALRAGGSAVDAAVATAFCLTVVAPHAVPLDASGALVAWEYRKWRATKPEAIEWGAGGVAEGAEAQPRLVCALARLHQEGAGGSKARLPWVAALGPAAALASRGVPVGGALAAAWRAAGWGAAPPELHRPALQRYLLRLQNTTSEEVAQQCGAQGNLQRSTAVVGMAGSWRVWAGGAGGARLLGALESALDPMPQVAEPDDPVERALYRVNKWMLSAENASIAKGTPEDTSFHPVGTGIAIVDTEDVYLSLVLGASVAFGSEAAAVGVHALLDDVAAADDGLKADGVWRDSPQGPLALAPAFLLQTRACGSRLVLGGGSVPATAAAAAALAAGELAGAAGLRGAVEHARGAEREAVNVVLQRGDELLSHADSRGGGVASRF